MINKHIFYCWFGGADKSEFEKHCIDSWKKCCPDYEITEINESNFNIHINEFCSEAYKNGNYAFVADVARMEILKNNSGFYLDTDIMLLKSLDELTKYDAIVPLNGKGFYNNAPIGCDTFIDIFEDAYNQLTFGKCLNTLLNKCCYDRYDLMGKDFEVFNNVAFLGNEYFVTPGYKVTPNTIGIHYCLGSWLDKWKGGYDKSTTFNAFELYQNGVRDLKTEQKYFGNNERIGVLVTYNCPMTKDLVFYGNYFYNPRVIKVFNKDFCMKRDSEYVPDESDSLVTIKVEDVYISYKVLTVAVDFDRCLIKDIPPLSEDYVLQDNARETLEHLTDMGVKFILNTARFGDYYDSAVNFIKEQELPIDIIDCEHKIRADVYIDDCNIFCKEINWYDIEQELLRIIRRI